MIEQIPNEPGIYILHILIKEDLNLEIGKLGQRFFPKGEYFYVGSAQGGLRKRIAHHLAKDKENFWHIDYLLSEEAVELKGIYWEVGAKKGEECGIALFLWSFGEGIDGFGSSDCLCESHLYRLSDEAVINQIRKSFQSIPDGM
ncbi:MAG: GIY-YIG nuclease family protein [bacterium]